MRSSSSLIELRHLRYFVAVAENLSFHRAAIQLNLSQQQVSQTISSLELIVKARLFERTTRKVTLTDAGLTLLARAHELFDHLDRAVSDTQLSSRGEDRQAYDWHCRRNRGEPAPARVFRFSRPIS